MGTLPAGLAAELRDRLALERAVETGTYQGSGLRTLGNIFGSATSIEISPAMAARAQHAVRELQNVRIVTGDSREELPKLIDATRPTFYWLDGHWSGSDTGGREDECPVLAELAATAAGHADDCILVDDARLFLASPPAPHDPLAWPTFMEIFELLHAGRPGHYITILADIVIAVPERAKPAVDAFAGTIPAGRDWPGQARALASRLTAAGAGRVRR